MKHLTRWVGLLIGSLLLIGMITDGGDGLLARGTHLRSVVVAETLSTSSSPVASPVGESHSTSSGPLAPHSDSPVQLPEPPSLPAPSPTDTPQPTVKAKSDAPPPSDDGATPAARAQSSAPVQTWPLDGFDLYVHTPPGAEQRQPLSVLLALHGMGAHGEAFAKSLVAVADRNGWLLVAPSMPYHNYMDPTVLTEDDVHLSQMLAATLDALPSRLGLKLQPRVLVYGFSRGAQLAHRFALFYPERVQAVAALSAGSYTLPIDKSMTESGIQPLSLPYGIADAQKQLYHLVNLEQFKKIAFLIAVGEKDTTASDVPRQFDPLIGKTRVERAKAFNQKLQSLGMTSQLVIVPNVGHEVNSEMRNCAVNFLKDNASQP